LEQQTVAMVREDDMADETGGGARPESGAAERGAFGADARAAQIASCRESLAGLFETMRTAATPALLALDLTLGQMRALVQLHAEGPQTVGGLARSLSVSEPTASQMVERLVQRGLAERNADPADRRRAVVTLTEHSSHAFEVIRTDSACAVDDWLARMGTDELAALALGLQALVLASGMLEGLTLRPAGDDAETAA
jgi:DNA-binding MarR family transcriptional regulator